MLVHSWCVGWQGIVIIMLPREIYVFIWLPREIFFDLRCHFAKIKMVVSRLTHRGFLPYCAYIIALGFIVLAWKRKIKEQNHDHAILSSWFATSLMVLTVLLTRITHQKAVVAYRYSILSSCTYTLYMYMYKRQFKNCTSL